MCFSNDNLRPAFIFKFLIHYKFSAFIKYNKNKSLSFGEFQLIAKDHKALVVAGKWQSWDMN